MLFYSKINSENKIEDEKIVKIKLRMKKCLPIVPCRFSNYLFALKKCRIWHIENLTSNKKFGHQAINEHSADKLTVAYIFEI